MRRHHIPLALGAILILQCAEASTPPEVLYAEMIESGMLEYRGRFPAEVTIGGARGSHTWDPASPNGPRCIGSGTAESERFTVTTNDRDSDDLIIYLQGGGLCSSQTDGACVREPIGYVPSGILSPSLDHPFAGANLAYIPYCDGSLYIGDTVQTLDGEEFVQRGRQNLTAALDTIAERFPEPRRIFLIGLSAGGYGTMFATPLVRIYYPEAQLLVVNDSGVGIARGEQQPRFMQDVAETLGAGGLIPESCTACVERGHPIDFVDWTLARDSAVRVVAISHTHDDVIANTFLGVDDDWFAEQLMRETGAMSDRYGSRYQRYLIEGDGHTVLVAGWVTSDTDPQSVFDWLHRVVADDPTVRDVYDTGL